MEKVETDGDLEVWRAEDGRLLRIYPLGDDRDCTLVKGRFTVAEITDMLVERMQIVTSLRGRNSAARKAKQEELFR